MSDRKKSNRADTQQLGSSHVVHAEPTKDLFIEMLTKDIGLIAAIVDLADNSVDGAKRMRGESRRYDGLWVRIETDANSFKISDNCGGIPSDIARHYAFKFGKDSGAPSLRHSIGEFGVGMKRAIFKLGKRFTITSKSSVSDFRIDESVVDWAKTQKWEFQFKTLREDISIAEDKTGTTIVVLDLHDDVAQSFRLESFRRLLHEELRTKLHLAASKGLSISLNGIPVKAEPIKLLADKRLRPAYKETRLPNSRRCQIRVKLWCGLGASEDRKAAGWHVYCNGRLIVRGDKSQVTGWGDRVDGIFIPGFHGQYNHLRGFAFFDADEPGWLPWNTTKTGINTDSPVYRATKLEMVRLMRPVVDFLNKLKFEKEGKDDAGEAGPLETMVQESEDLPLFEVKTRKEFTTPRVQRRRRDIETQKIQYTRLREDIEKVKKHANVTSLKKVGEITFDFYLHNEVAD